MTIPPLPDPKSLFDAVKWATDLLPRLWRFVTGSRSRVPRDTIRVVPIPRKNRWNSASVGGNPAMQVVCSLHVTNITDDTVKILRAYIKRPHTDSWDVDTILHNPYGRRVAGGSYPIPPKQTAEVHALFFVVPPVREKGKEFKAKVVLIDQFGNEHKLKKISFPFL